MFENKPQPGELDPPLHPVVEQLVEAAGREIDTAGETERKEALEMNPGEEPENPENAN